MSWCDGAHRHAESAALAQSLGSRWREHTAQAVRATVGIAPACSKLTLVGIRAKGPSLVLMYSA